MNYKKLLIELKSLDESINSVKEQKRIVLEPLAEQQRKLESQKEELRAKLTQQLLDDDTVTDEDGYKRISVDNIGEATLGKDREKIVIENEAVVLEELKKRGFDFSVVSLDTKKAKSWYEATGEDTDGMKRVEEPSLRVVFKKGE